MIIKIVEQYDLKGRGTVLVMDKCERVRRPDFSLNIGDNFTDSRTGLTHVIKGIEMFMCNPPIVGALLVE